MPSLKLPWDYRVYFSINSTQSTAADSDHTRLGTWLCACGYGGLVLFTRRDRSRVLTSRSCVGSGMSSTSVNKKRNLGAMQTI